MCRGSKALIACASLFGLFQSVVWIAVTVVIVLIHFCLISITEYRGTSDFFRVTLVKLYFEGPKCIPDGSYLGKFNEDYRDSINLLGRDLIMFLVIAYIILDVVYFSLSLALFLKRDKPRKKIFTVAWSVNTLVLCALDALMTYTFIVDSFTLMHYILNTPELEDVLLGSIAYIPLLLAFVSSRFVIVWIWNFCIGIYLLFVGLCGSPVPQPKAQAFAAISLKEENGTDKRLDKVEERINDKDKRPEGEPNEVKDERKLLTEDNDSVNIISENFGKVFDKNAYPEYSTYRRSMEAVTRFSNDDRMLNEHCTRNWCYAPPSEMVFHPKLQWAATNEGYVDNEESPRNVDFEHNLKNFESGQKKVKVAKNRPGKPVGIPVPPPLPPIGSCNC